MKKKKHIKIIKIIIYIILFFVFIFSIKKLIFANDLLEKKWYALYEQRVEEICWIYKNVDTKAIIATEEYKRIEYDESTTNWETITNWDNVFEEAKETYENNMNNIYKCALFETQISVLTFVKDTVLKTSNNQELSEETENKLNEKIDKIKTERTDLQCRNSNDDDSIKKVEVLEQTTYELCKYHTYLEYLRNYNWYLDRMHSTEDDFSEWTNQKIALFEINRKNELDEELKHIYKVFPMAFNAYKQYEDNFSTHVLLELIQDDYKLVRDDLHKVLNPINQLVYKLSNAMKLE